MSPNISSLSIGPFRPILDKNRQQKDSQLVISRTLIRSEKLKLNYLVKSMPLKMGIKLHPSTRLNTLKLLRLLRVLKLKPVLLISN